MDGGNDIEGGGLMLSYLLVGLGFGDTRRCGVVALRFDLARKSKRKDSTQNLAGIFRGYNDVGRVTAERAVYQQRVIYHHVSCGSALIERHIYEERMYHLTRLYGSR